MKKGTVFIFKDYEDKLHYYTKENLQTRNKDWILIGVDDIKEYINSLTILQSTDFASFLNKDMEIKELILDGLNFSLVHRADILSFRIIDGSQNNIFEVNMLNATYAEYLTGMKLIAEKIKMLQNGGSRYAAANQR